MSIENIIDEKPVTITNNGMITIPAILRKRYNLKDGDKVFVIEDGGALKIIPIKKAEEIRKDSYSVDEMKTEMEKSKNEELEREY